MLIKRQSIFTRKENEREIDITPVQLCWWQSGMPIKDAAPQLSADDRYFLISGVTPEEWDVLFPEEEWEQ